MHAMNTLNAAWSSAPSRPPSGAARLFSPPAWPAHLHMRTLDRAPDVVRVGFSLGRVTVLSPCELEVARWANWGRSNPAIASLRQTSIHTVARQMANIISKLCIGSRLDLATIPELNAWAPPRLRIPSNGSHDGTADSWLSEDGLLIDPTEIARIWREIAMGHWSALASVDVGNLSYVAVRRVSCKTVDWAELNARQRDVLGLVARGFAQKVIAMKLRMAPSTVSSHLQSARRRLGFGSFAQLVRAYCAARDVIEETGRGLARLAP
jgi:DNA-binding NarL/FixJ family response regulator